MNNLGNIIGEICKAVLPINEEFYVGNPNSDTAICTLGSINLLKEMKNSNILHNVAIVGRLLSENKGIDSIIRYANQNKNVKRIIICGKEVWGHKTGHSLIKLHENGIDENKRIVGSSSPDPFLSVSKSEIEYFQKEIKLLNLIGNTNIKEILIKI